MSRRRRVMLLALVLLVGVIIVVVFFDPDRRVIGRINREPFYKGRAASAWEEDLSGGDKPESAEALPALVAGKRESVAVCAWVLRNGSDEAARGRAADAIAQMGPDAAPAKPELVAALSDSDPLVRRVVIRTIGELAPDVPGAVVALTNRFPDVEAIIAISKFGPAAAEAVPALTSMLRYGDPNVRRQAARALGRIREPALPALPQLIRLTRSDPDPLVEHAAEAIGDIGPTAAEGVPALVKALSDPVARVRRDAVRSLGQIGPAAKAALPDVRRAADDPDEDVKKAAVRAARLIDPASAQKSN